jgi:hypothetical protein
MNVTAELGELPPCPQQLVTQSRAGVTLAVARIVTATLGLTLLNAHLRIRRHPFEAPNEGAARCLATLISLLAIATREGIRSCESVVTTFWAPTGPVVRRKTALSRCNVPRSSSRSHRVYLITCASLVRAPFRLQCSFPGASMLPSRGFLYSP